MELEIQITKKVEVKKLRVNVAVRYDEEDMPNDYPFRCGSNWDVLIDVDSGQIQDWPEGVEPLSFDMKVCDCGNYTLLDADGNSVMSIDQSYVPNKLVPGEWGDYIALKINEVGMIENWPGDLTEENFLDFYENED